MSHPRPSVPWPVSRIPDAGIAAGDASFGLVLDAVRIRLSGLDDALCEGLHERFGAYAAQLDPADAGALHVEVGLEDRAYFIDPPESPEPNPVLVAVDASTVRFMGYRVAGWVRPEEGRGVLRLAHGDYEPAERAVENYIRCAVAWRALLHGGAFVHAASIVHRGSGYLFFGHSGAGKSTLASCDRRGRVVSDDLSLVLPGRERGLDLIGTPFRGTYEGGAPVVGRFPLRAGFRLVQASAARVREVPRTVAFSGLVANLPFVVDALDARPGLLDSISRAFADVPLRHLDFRRDDSFWEAIEEAGLLPDPT
jgi:hypothetical protein